MKKIIVNIAKIYDFYFSGLVLCTQECPATGSMDDGLYPRMIWFSMPFGSNSRPCRSQLPSIRVARLSARPIWVVYSLWILPSVLSANHCSAGTTTTRHVIVKYSSSEAVVPETLTASQLRNNVRGLAWVCIFNYTNPVYGVATICHQVRWLRWGHPSLFHTATSRLIWYKMFCVRDKSYKLIWMEFINMFSVYAKSGTHSRFNW